MCGDCVCVCTCIEPTIVHKLLAQGGKNVAAQYVVRMPVNEPQALWARHINIRGYYVVLHIARKEQTYDTCS